VVEVVLLLEFKRVTRRLENRQERAISHLVKGVQHTGLAARLRFLDFEGVHQRQPQELLIELPGLFGVAAAVGIVVKTIDHRTIPHIINSRRHLRLMLAKISADARYWHPGWISTIGQEAGSIATRSGNLDHKIQGQCPKDL
jgi:hypothetical protein